MKRNIFKTLLLGLLSLLSIPTWAIANYLCFTAEQDNTEIKLLKYGNPTNNTIEYSTDGGYTWFTFTMSAISTAYINPVDAIVVTLNKGEKIYWRRQQVIIDKIKDIKEPGLMNFSTSEEDFYKFSIDKPVKASGSVMSLVDQSATAKVIPCPYCFYMLFEGCNLTSAPELPATTLDAYCYKGMFYKCDNIKNAPELPATTLKTGCYSEMFPSCTKVKYMKVGFTSWLSGATSNWAGLAPSGIFECPSSLTVKYGGNYIPEGWSVKTSDSFILSVPSFGWATMYLPKAVSIPTGVEVYYASAVSGTKITLTALTEKIPAETAVLVKATGESNVPFTFLSETLTPVTGNLLEGCSKETSYTAGDALVLAGASGDTPLFQNYTGSTLGMYKAYLPSSVFGSPVKGVNFVFEDGTNTGIEAASVLAPASKEMYNLGGVPVNDTYKGIVIKNGKKMWNK